MFYSKALNWQLSGEEIQTKAGLNSIRTEGRCYLLNNVMKYWEEYAIDNFQDYSCPVSLLYGRDNVLLAKADMQRWTVRRDVERSQIPYRTLAEVEGGHDLANDNYEAFIKHIYQFI